MVNLEETFFTVIGCMDGRVQKARAEFGRKKFGAEYPDTITEPGIVGILANNPSNEFLAHLKKEIDISLNLHHSKGILVGGHAECAGNPVDNEKQKDQIRTAANVVRSLINSSVPIIPIFGHRSAKDLLVWEIEELSETELAATNHPFV